MLSALQEVSGEKLYPRLMITDPTMHGEITAIRHCTEILRERGWSAQRILQSWKDFSLYTNGEPCPMCASAIRWAGFKEVIYGSSIKTIAESKCSLHNR